VGFLFAFDVNSAQNQNLPRNFMDNQLQQGIPVATALTIRVIMLLVA